MEHVIVTKENFFSRFKPASELFLVSGETVTSKPVLEIIRKGKLFMEAGDVDGFFKLMMGPEYINLSEDDARQLSRTKITAGGTTVFEILSDISDFYE